jgi:hypothetical protein
MYIQLQLGLHPVVVIMYTFTKKQYTEQHNETEHTERYPRLGRHRRRWEDNIKMDVEQVGGGRGDWMELAYDSDR